MKHDNKGRGGHQPNRPQTNYTAMTEYYDDNGNLRREVFIQWPKQVAETLSISRTNMRRAYDFVAAMKFRIQMGEDATTVLQPGMGQLYRFVQYQAGRDPAWDKDKNFFQAHINAVGYRFLSRQTGQAAEPSPPACASSSVRLSSKAGKQPERKPHKKGFFAAKL